MIALVQRVNSASVSVAQQSVADINKGLLVLVGVRHSDTSAHVEKLLTKLTRYRIFPDEQGRMNLDILEAGGELLLVPQFTLAADTQKGRRPGFSTAAPPEQAEVLFDAFCRAARQVVPVVQTGVFGADMQVALINDGPVTFWLEI